MKRKCGIVHSLYRLWQKSKCNKKKLLTVFAVPTTLNKRWNAKPNLHLIHSLNSKRDEQWGYRTNRFLSLSLFNFEIRKKITEMMVVHHLCEFHHFNLIYQFNRFIYSETKSALRRRILPWWSERSRAKQVAYQFVNRKVSSSKLLFGVLDNVLVCVNLFSNIYVWWWSLLNKCLVTCLKIGESLPIHLVFRDIFRFFLLLVLFQFENCMA